MANSRLKKEEIDRLLSDLFAERRMLTYKLDRVREAITGLKSERAEKEDAASAKEAKAARKAAGAAKRKTRRKPGRRKKRETGRGYRLNDWDNMVAGAIAKADKPLAKKELLEKTSAWAKKTYAGMSDAEVEQKLTRTLQKLSGKRGVLGQHRTGRQRGVHYGLVDWFFHGKLREAYRMKV